MKSLITILLVLLVFVGCAGHRELRGQPGSGANQRAGSADDELWG